jgi:hypothetical protein
MESIEVGGVSIALPPTSADIELEHLKTTDGKPVTVRCGRVPAEMILEALRGLPGDSPKTALAEEPDEVERATQVAQLVSRCGQVIEAGTSLVGPDGKPVFPAFGPGLIPVSVLRIADSAEIIGAISQLSGVGTQASQRARFRYEHGDRLVDGAGAGRSGGEVREEAVGAAGEPGDAGG